MPTERRERPVKPLSLFAALIPIISIIVVMLVAVLRFGAEPHIPLILCTGIAAIVGIAHGHKWADLQKAALKSVTSGLEAVLILALMGGLVATWIISGTVPAMVYYGLEIIHPKIFLFASCALCALVSLACGSSWTTAATIGIALMGIGTGLGVNPALTAGAVISGVYFGDRLSPMSDFTNLTSAVTRVNLFDHIRHMLPTSVPALALALLIYLILGLGAVHGQDTAIVDSMRTTLEANFNLNPFLLLPPVLVILMVVFRVPAIPGMVGGIALGCIMYILFQGGGGDWAAAAENLLNSINYGASIITGDQYIDSLLNRGGIQGMMGTISLMIFALAFGGVLDEIGSSRTISVYLLKAVRKTGSLVLLTIATCICCNALTGDVYVSIVLPNQMYGDEFKRQGLSTTNLSRALEDGACVSSCLFPWNACGAYMTATLGVNSFVYAPFAFANLFTPVISVIFGFTGFTMTKMTPEERRQAAAELAEKGEQMLETSN